MTFVDARDELLSIIASLGYTTYEVAPLDLGIPKGIVVMLFPAGPTPTRRPGGKKQNTFNQRIQVMQALIGGREKTVSRAVQNAAISIGDELDSHVTLSGHAVDTADGVAWDDAGITEYPPGKGILFLAISGTLPMTVEQSVTYAS